GLRYRPARQGEGISPPVLSPRADAAAARRPARRARRPAAMRAGPLAYVLAGAALLGLTALAFAVGRYPVALSEILNLLASKLTGAPHGLASSVETVVLQVRGPRVLAALVV